MADSEAANAPERAHLTYLQANLFSTIARPLSCLSHSTHTRLENLEIFPSSLPEAKVIGLCHTTSGAIQWKYTCLGNNFTLASFRSHHKTKMTDSIYQGGWKKT